MHPCGIGVHGMPHPVAMQGVQPMQNMGFLQMGMMGQQVLPMGMPMMGVPMGFPMGVAPMGQMGQMAHMPPMLAGVSPVAHINQMARAAVPPAAPAPAPVDIPKDPPREVELTGNGLANQVKPSETTSASGAGDESSAAVSSSAKQKAESDDEKALAVTRCHLHKKPNAKCKFCQRAQKKLTEDKASGNPASASGKAGAENDDAEDYSRRTFNCSPMLKDQILSSTYFKSLLAITGMEDLVDEIASYADTLDVYNSGSTVNPSCFACHVYRVFTLPHAEDLGELSSIIDSGNAIVRCVGFLYLRFVVPPAHLFAKFEEYLFDDMELTYPHGGKQVITTIGEYVESLLVRDKYFSTPLPRIPVKVRQMLEKELAPLSQYRKRMEANRKAFKSLRVADLAVEVVVNGSWEKGICKELVGRAAIARSVRVKLEDGGDVKVHLGKVVLREPARAVSRSGSSSGSRSRSRSRRQRSPDWSRFKGRSDADMVEELREKAREDAVCGQGKSYSTKPMRGDVVLATRVERGTHESRLIEEDRDRGNTYRKQRVEADDSVESEATRKRRQEEQLEYAKRQRDIFEKYGSTKASATKNKASDMETPDLLRLG